MIEVLYGPTPNGWKISIMLEECGLPYEIRPVYLSRGDHYAPEFLAGILSNDYIVELDGTQVLGLTLDRLRGDHAGSLPSGALAGLRERGCHKAAVIGEVTAYTGTDAPVIFNR